MDWDNHGSYSINWFKKMKFNEDELNIIELEIEKLINMSF